METWNPGALIENQIRKEILSSFLDQNKCNGSLLDLGCGPKPYASIYRPYFEKTTGADLKDSPFPKNEIDLYCTATEVPLPDSSVDFILCTEVLHDLPEPDMFFAEVKRLLKNNGILFLTSPFVVPIVDGIYDHYRYTEYGLRYRIEKAGLEASEIIPVGDLFATLLTISIKPFLKLLNRISKSLQWKGIYSEWNPFLLLFIILPQKTYLFLRRFRILRRLFKKFEYCPIGYVSIVRKIS